MEEMLDEQFFVDSETSFLGKAVKMAHFRLRERTALVNKVQNVLIINDVYRLFVCNNCLLQFKLSLGALQKPRA